MSISSEFKEGIYEIYSEFFEVIKYFPLDTENTPVDNVYGEATQKVYSDIVTLLAKPSSITEKEGEASGKLLSTMTFTVPLKSFELAGVSVDDLNILAQGIIVFLGKHYKILNITRGLILENIPLSYIFTCEEDTRVHG